METSFWEITSELLIQKLNLPASCGQKMTFQPLKVLEQLKSSTILVRLRSCVILCSSYDAQKFTRLRPFITRDLERFAKILKIESPKPDLLYVYIVLLILPYNFRAPRYHFSGVTKTPRLPWPSVSSYQRIFIHFALREA